jgi:hypothetical protein
MILKMQSLQVNINPITKVLNKQLGINIDSFLENGLKNTQMMM